MFVKKITNEAVILDVPAKVNLFLEVLGKRDDGYHNIHSLFQMVTLYDTLEVRLSDSPGIELEIESETSLPNGSDNLICRAYNLMQEQYGLKGGVKVKLIKRIPVAAGLGGGSADAASMILALNRLFNINLTQEEMSQRGLEIGSDLPFFFSRGQAIVTGRGEEIQETSLPTDYHIILVTPRLEISTQVAYRQLKRVLTKPKQPFSLDSCSTPESLLSKLAEIGNDFESTEAVKLPIFGLIRRLLEQSGARLVRMSGSGPTMLGFYIEKPDLRMFDDEHGEDWQIHLVTPVCRPEN